MRVTFPYAVRPNRILITLAELTARWPDLDHTTVVALDLRDQPLDWSEARVPDAVFLGCALPGDAMQRVVGDGGAVIAGFTDVPFSPYRTALYTYDELTTIDAAIGAWAATSSTGMYDGLARAVHDAAIDAAVARFVADRRVVGVMGSHALTRDDAHYRDVAEVGRALTRAGYCVATGGGPGVMEAANFGAWFATYSDDEFGDALALLATSPSYHRDAAAYVDRALEVRARWPRGADSLGVPTWVYIDEPTTAFATHVAKYFTNSIRENGLLAIARVGVVYAPGGPGTAQEIFTDAAQNSLTLYSVRSPMVFFRVDTNDARRELVSAVRRQARDYGWEDLVAACDTTDEVVAFLAAHQPQDAATTTVDRRRTHRRGTR